MTSDEVKQESFQLHQQAREMALRVLEMCYEEEEEESIYLNLKCSFARAVRYTGLSSNTLRRIGREARAGALRTPCKKGKVCNKKNNLSVGSFDRSLIHRCIEDLYLSNKNVVPSTAKLLAAIREKIDFPWKESSLRKLLKAMGYQWLKGHGKRRILVERPDVMFPRSKYLRKIHQHRLNNRNIFYVNDTWMDQNLTSKECWRNNLNHAALIDSSPPNKLIFVHAASRSGFLNGAQLVYESDTASGHYRGPMSSANFEKWCTDMLLPRLPAASVLVLDDTRYDCVIENKLPTKSSTKLAMINWLVRNNVQFVHTETTRKDELFRLIEVHKPVEKTFRIDQIFKRHGHEVLKLPPYMCDLNPVEFAWAKIKKNLRENCLNSNLTLQELRECTEKAMTEVTEQEWCALDDHVITLEAIYWENDRLMENALDAFLIDTKRSENWNSDSEMSLND